MFQLLAERLDASFSALSGSTRRGVLEQLGREEVTAWIDASQRLGDARFSDFDQVIEALNSTSSRQRRDS